MWDEDQIAYTEKLIPRRMKDRHKLLREKTARAMRKLSSQVILEGGITPTMMGIFRENP